MKIKFALLGLLAALLAIVATGCGGAALPPVGESGKDTFVFIYTDG